VSTIARATKLCHDGGMAETATLEGRAGAAGDGRRTLHGQAWTSLSRTQAAVSLRLQTALAEGGFPPLPWYEVLETVAEAPEQRMRMGELAETLVITRGGLTKLVDRMVKAGLIERTFCEEDRRVSYATLCDDGRQMLAQMRPIVTAELEAAFSAQLSEAQAAGLRDTLEMVRGSACRNA
jgi:DNA-binding MarR family transcriptional regulator